MLNIAVTQQLNARFKALLCFASKKDVRYYLNAVLLDVKNGTLRAVATDGNVLGVAILEGTDSPDGQYILPREFMERIVKTRDIYTLTVTAEGATASHGHSAKPVDAKFPDWRRVCNYAEGAQSVTMFDADILARIAKASRELGNTNGYFKLTQFGEFGAPWQIAEDFCGIIMPLRKAFAETVDRAEFDATVGGALQ